jgi:diaminopimelate decarboxylase
MSSSCCSGDQVPLGRQSLQQSAEPVGTPVDALRAAVQSYGTPIYVYDVNRLRGQIAKLRTKLPSAIQVLYSLKANASLGLCGVLAEGGLGADVASAGELVTALAAGFPPWRILVSGPDKSPALLAQLQAAPQALLSVDSLSELQVLARREVPQRALLRLRPDFASLAACAAGADSRFGVLFEELPRCHDYLGAIRVVGFHVFSGSQVLEAAAVIHHLRAALDLCLRAADRLGIAPELFDLGGGFGIPYGAQDQELDLGPIADALGSLAERASPARLVLELGRYLVAQAGWYLTTVIARQTHRGREAVVVDGGVHQRGDLCGLGLRSKAFPPVVLSAPTGRAVPAEKGDPPFLAPRDVLGCLSLPSDILAEASLLPPLSVGDVLAFPNAGGYGLMASPALFHGHPVPAEVAFEGASLKLLRTRQPASSILEGQTCLRPVGASTPS